MTPQWKAVLHMLENATGGWITTWQIYDELHVKNPSQRIEEIERYTDHRVIRETIRIRGRNAARYKLAPPETAQLFELPEPPAANAMWDDAA